MTRPEMFAQMWRPTGCSSFGCSGSNAASGGVSGKIVLCNGFALEGLPTPFARNYPFARHAKELPWRIPNDEARVFARGTGASNCSMVVEVGACRSLTRIRRPNCPMHLPCSQYPSPRLPWPDDDDEMTDSSSASCSACALLAHNTTLKRIIEMANDPSIPASRTHDPLLTFTQQIERKSIFMRRSDKQRLGLYNSGEKIKRLGRAMTVQQQVIQLTASHDLPRGRLVLARCLERNASAKIMLRQLKLAVEGRYNPRPDVTQDAIDHAEHVLILGGPRALHALQRSHGFLSRSTVMQHTPRPRFITSWSDKMEEATIRQNLQRFALARLVHRGMGGDGGAAAKSIYHLMLDDVAIEARRRPSPEDNLMRGYARESDFNGVTFNVDSHAVLVAFKKAEDDKKLVLGEELTVFAIGPNRGHDYAISLTAAISTAKKGAKAEHMRPMIESHVSLWQSEGAWQERGPISTIVKDGAAIMNQAVFPYTTKFELDRTCPMGQALFGVGVKTQMLFFCLCGNSPSEPVVDACDDKHWAKRFRMAMKRRKGIKIGDCMFNKVLLSRLLEEIGYDAASVNTWWGDGAEDAQNVPAMTKLMLALSSFATKQISDFPEKRRDSTQFSEMLYELRILGTICGLVFELVTMQDATAAAAEQQKFLTVAELDRRASQLAHVYFVCFRRNGSSFVPNQHYYNVQITMRQPGSQHGQGHFGVLLVR